MALEFSLSEQACLLLKSVIPAAIDRKLRKEKERSRIKGIHAT